MLDLINVTNIPISEIEDQNFEIGVFASGFESRSSFLARKLNKENFKYIIILGFSEHQSDDVRIENDEFYDTNYSRANVVKSADDREIYVELLKIFDLLKKDKTQNPEKVRILLDYTSMSRTWYSAILNFVRLQDGFCVNVFINYSLGQYAPGLLDYSYSSINSIPSHEGTLSSNSKILLVLGIGFSPYLIKSVIEEIEPNLTIGILPIPNKQREYQTISESIKNDILTKDIDEWIKCPIDNLENIFRTYAEITNNNLNSKDLIFLSLGPKVFTMASLLVGQRFNQVTCLYLKSSLKKSDVKPTGDFICNRIFYK